MLRRLLPLLSLVLIVTTIQPAFADQRAMAMWTPAPDHPSSELRVTMYALQATDAILSGVTFNRHPGDREGNPQMRPFSHGGVPMFIAGYAVWDIVSGALTRRFKASHKDLITVQQIGSNVDGILTTAATARMR